MRGTAALLALLLLAACGQRWEAFVYPDRADRKAYARLGTFSSLDECRSAARARIFELSGLKVPDAEPDYECGRGCRSGAAGAGELCAEVAR